MEPSLRENIQVLLEPLQRHQASSEYHHQHQAMVDFYHCLRALEARYADLFQQVQVLEKKLFMYP